MDSRTVIGVYARVLRASGERREALACANHYTRHRLRYNAASRAYWRNKRAFKRRFAPWAHYLAGTDCDGMRWGGVTFYWTRRSAVAAEDDAWVSAEGPQHSEIISGADARALGDDCGGWVDGRDRFAEKMGY